MRYWLFRIWQGNIHLTRQSIYITADEVYDKRSIGDGNGIIIVKICQFMKEYWCRYAYYVVYKIDSIVNINLPITIDIAQVKIG